MSIDPAINASIHLKDVMDLSELKVTSSAVYIFDFDGVITSRVEDDIYRLSPRDDEISLLEKAAHNFQIHCAGMELRYQRHLLYQAAAWILQLPIEPGPAWQQAIEAGKQSQLFILTARSGWHAVERMREFLEIMNIRPTEIYNVGRVKKDRQIDLLCREFQSKTVFFIDDSNAHLADAGSISAANLRLVAVKATLQPKDDDLALRRHYEETIVTAIRVGRENDRLGLRT
jgi:hypothetical protein